MWQTNDGQTDGLTCIRVIQSAVRASVCLSVNTCSARRYISPLSGWVSVKLGRNIPHVSGHCWNVFKFVGQRSTSQKRSSTEVHWSTVRRWRSVLLFYQQNYASRYQRSHAEHGWQRTHRRAALHSFVYKVLFAWFAVFLSGALPSSDSWLSLCAGNVYDSRTETWTSVLTPHTC